MPARATNGGMAKIGAGQVGAVAAPAAPQAGAAPSPPGAKRVIEGDPREDSLAFKELADGLREAYRESLHKGIVAVSVYTDIDSAPLLFTISQPFMAKGERYAVLQDEDGRPLYVFDLEMVEWSSAALMLLQAADLILEGRSIARIEVEVGGRW